MIKLELKGVGVMGTIICIICNEQKKPSIEHIIPEALGNKKLKTKMVCEECNNKLGEKIDYYLTDNFFCKLARKKYNFTGKKNKEINIFNSVMTDMKGDRYDINENENSVSFKPMIKKTETGFVAKATTLKEAEDIAIKRLNRLKKESNQIKNIMDKAKITKTKLEPPVFQTELEIDLKVIYLAIIKIAYEYACEKLGSVYFVDKHAECLRNELYEVIYNDKPINQKFLSKTIMIAPDFVKERINEFKENLKDLPNEVVHIISLYKGLDNQLICEIYLFLNPTLSYVVRLSNNADKYLKEKSTCIDLLMSNGNILSF